MVGYRTRRAHCNIMPLAARGPRTLAFRSDCAPPPGVAVSVSAHTRQHRHRFLFGSGDSTVQYCTEEYGKSTYSTVPPFLRRSTPQQQRTTGAVPQNNVPVRCEGKQKFEQFLDFDNGFCFHRTNNSLSLSTSDTHP